MALLSPTSPATIATTPVEPDTFARAHAIVMKKGHHCTAFQTLERGLRHWFDPEVDALVAYVEQGRYRIAVGPPVAAPFELGGVVARFAADCRRAGRRPLFFSVDEDFERAVDGACASLYIGEQPEWRPADYTVEGRACRTLRAQVRRGARTITVRRLDPERLDGPTRERIQDVIAAWQANRPMSIMSFMVDVQPFEHIEDRRIYLAEDPRGALVAFLVAVPVVGRQGWFIEDVIRDPGAPNGTAELLIHTALTDAAEREDRYVTLGMAPLSGVPKGPGKDRLMRGLFRFCARELSFLYGFSSLRRFKQRFQPHRWSPQYLVAVEGRVSIFAMIAVLRAFAGGGLLSFGLDTARRVYTRVPGWFWWLAAFMPFVYVGGGVLIYALLMRTLLG